MDHDRWTRIDRLFHEALSHPSETRHAFLRQACGGDEELNRELTALLESQKNAGSFLEMPAMHIAAKGLGGLEDGQLSPGTLIAGRYTVGGLVGRGGMGEVYRARDNKLDQFVALKLLSAALRNNALALIALHTEVRLARQVSHPNVCRVHDIGEADGLHFLTMEFIEGDNLANVLHRDGPFSQDKGLKIARQICDALSAAHERGVLHRDLKPVNVMLRDSGDVVVTDFGLAALAEGMNAAESRSGTPGYMAPEQAEGGNVTVRSDIYALGLVLHEIFTGRPASERTPVKNPKIERAISCCLERDPECRPATALAVASLLPGGDPLQIAIDAGQTPPPEMVAASGEKAGINVRSALICVIAALIVMFCLLRVGGRPQVLNRAPLHLPPEALAAKARQIAAEGGYSQWPQGRGFGFLYDNAQIRLREQSGWADTALRAPSPVRFWYRESRHSLASYEMRGIAWNDPPQDSPGMIAMQMDGAGRLTYFRALPMERDGSIAAPNWAAFILAAGLDSSSLFEVSPETLPPGFADSRWARIGAVAGQPESQVRVEAAALHGHPVYFRVIPTWEEKLDVAFQISARPYPPSYPAGATIFLGALTLAAARTAWRNVKSGRGDRRGAFRVAATVFMLWIIYAFSIGFGQLQGAADRWWLIPANALYWAVTVWIYYMALEPLVRKSRPYSLISWSRLLSGKFSDALVGRDILIGILAASGFVLLRNQLPITIGSPIPTQAGAFIGILPVALAASASGTLFLSVVFTVSWIFSRRLWIAFLAATAFQFIINYFTGLLGGHLLEILACLVYSLILATLLVRFGVLACYAGAVTSYVLFALPLGRDFTAWYQTDGRVCVFLLALLAIFGFRSALAGRKLLQL
jgi:serine/threonine-protein kinase